MATIDILDAQGKKSGSRDLAADIFEAPVSVPLMHQVVIAGLAGLRAGTHSTKTRGEVSGGGRKPWRQKGTGRARQGSIRSPQWVGGGVAHGPQPRDHSMRVNKKMRKGALRSALTDALASGKLAVVSEIAFDEPKTKRAVELLSALELSGNVLVVLARADRRRRGREVVPQPHRREGRLRGWARHLRRAVGRPRAPDRRRARRARGQGLRARRPAPRQVRPREVAP